MGPHVFHPELASPGLIIRSHAAHHKCPSALREQIPSINTHPMARLTVSVGGAVMGGDWEVGTQATGVPRVCKGGTSY